MTATAATAMLATTSQFAAVEAVGGVRLLRGGVGESEARLHSLFAAAAARAPYCLVFDDAHALFPAGSSSSGGGGGGGGGGSSAAPRRGDEDRRALAGLAAVMRACLADALRAGVLVLACAPTAADVDAGLLDPAYQPRRADVNVLCDAGEFINAMA
jgi:SpoVK/Ycf46/Vps4 family AAA+-type ATPase